MNLDDSLWLVNCLVGFFSGLVSVYKIKWSRSMGVFLKRPVPMKDSNLTKWYAFAMLISSTCLHLYSLKIFLKGDAEGIPCSGWDTLGFEVVKG